MPTKIIIRVEDQNGLGPYKDYHGNPSTFIKNKREVFGFVNVDAFKYWTNPARGDWPIRPNNNAYSVNVYRVKHHRKHPRLNSDDFSGDSSAKDFLCAREVTFLRKDAELIASIPYNKFCTIIR